MNRYTKFALIFFLFLILILSCDKKPTDDGSGYGKTVVANNVIVIDDLRGIELFRVESAGTKYIFKIDGTYEHTIVAGKIIVGTEYGGYIRLVTRVIRNLRELELTTEDATLNDAVKNGLMDTTIHLGIGLNSSPNKDNFTLISAEKGFTQTEYGADLSGLKLFSGVADGVNVDVEITEGSFSFDPSIEYAVGITTAGLREFYTIMNGNLNFNYDAAIIGNGKFSILGLKNIAQYQYYIVQRFGTVPVAEVIKLSIDVGFEITATIDGAVECGTEANYDFTAGAGWKGGDWWNSWKQAPSFSEKPLNWPGNGKTHVKIYIKPSIGVSFYSVPSSEVSVKAYVDFDGQIDSYPSWCWQIKNGITGTYGFQLQMLGSQAPNYSNSFAVSEWPQRNDCETATDNVGPSPITDLTAASPFANGFTLIWTSSGDDGDVGKASEYDIRYSKTPITLSNWGMATQCIHEPNPLISGSVQEFTISGLAPITRYYTAMKVADEIGFWSEMSNVATIETAEAEDNTPPAQVTDLFAGSPTSTTMTLTWTARGDDITIGTASYYDIRFSTGYINVDNWEFTISCQGVPNPSPAGSQESFVITNLVPNTIYYFAMKSADEELNWSGISNMAGERTLPASERGNIIDYYDSPVPSYTLDMAGDGTSLWVIGNIADTVYKVDQAGGDLLDIFVFSPGENIDLQGIAWDGSNLWIASRSNIYKVDPESGLEMGHFQYDQSIGLITGLTWGDDRLWAAGPTAGYAYEINVETALLDGNIENSITNQLAFSSSSLFRGILYYDNKLYISIWTNAEKATVFEYDAFTEELLDQFHIMETDPVLHNPVQGGLATDLTYLYVGGDYRRILITKF